MLWQQQWESWKVECQGELWGGDRGFLNTGTRAPRTKIDTLDQAGLRRERGGRVHWGVPGLEA